MKNRKETIQVRVRKKLAPYDARVLVEYVEKNQHIHTGIVIKKHIQAETKKILDSAGIRYIDGVGEDTSKIEEAQSYLYLRINDEWHHMDDVSKNTETESDLDFTSELKFSQKENSSETYKGHTGLTESMVESPAYPAVINQDETEEENEDVQNYVTECTDEFSDDDIQRNIQDEIRKSNNIEYRIDVRLISRKIKKDTATRLVNEVTADSTLLLGIAAYRMSQKAEEILKKCNRIIVINFDLKVDPFELRAQLIDKLKLLREKLSQTNQPIKCEKNLEIEDTLFNILYNSLELNIELLKNEFICKDLGFDMLKRSIHCMVDTACRIHMVLMHQIHEISPEVIARYFGIDSLISEKIVFDARSEGYVLSNENKNIELSIDFNLYDGVRKKHTMTRKIYTHIE